MNPAAGLAPALVEMRRRVAALGNHERAALLESLRERLAKQLTGGAPGDWISLYLLLWLIDQAIIADYSAKDTPFSLLNPPTEYWYQRVDTAGTHEFFKEGDYLINAIPAVTEAKYYNSEIYNSTLVSPPPSNVIVNLFPVDDPKDTDHFLYDLLLNVPYVPSNGISFSASVRAENLNGGSRGWGFWNTCALPFNMQIAWFIQLDGTAPPGVTPVPAPGFYAIAQNGLGYQPFELPPLDEGWHDYQITVTKEVVKFLMDGVLVHQVTDTACIPSAPMAFHNWVDNALFGFTSSLLLEHILQRPDKRRTNFMRNLRIESLP